MKRKAYYIKSNNTTHTNKIIVKRYDQNRMEEYKMLREEIVTYMEKLQTVRNMMFVTLGAIFAFSISDDVPFFCTLLPLLFVFPSYIAAVNYWNCVRKASAYLVVFHESYKDCPIHWESRHNMYRKISNKKGNFSKSALGDVRPQLLPYFICAAITLIIYWLQLFKYVNIKLSYKISTFLNINIDGFSILVYIIVGFMVMVFSVIIFVVFSKNESYDSFLKKFLMIKYNEQQKDIGKCWPNNKIIDTIDCETKINKMIDKYL